jgi:hypothetical protein
MTPRSDTLGFQEEYLLLQLKCDLLVNLLAPKLFWKHFEPLSLEKYQDL